MIGRTHRRAGGCGAGYSLPEDDVAGLPVAVHRHRIATDPLQLLLIWNGDACQVKPERATKSRKWSLSYTLA